MLKKVPLVEGSVSRPNFETTKSTNFFGYHVRSKGADEKRSNWQNFENGVNYLRNIYNFKNTDLDKRLTERVAHYRAKGERQRTFTESDFKKLETEAMKSDQALYPQLRSVFDKYKCSPDQQLTIMKYGLDMLKDGNKAQFAVEVCKSMAILFASGIEEILPSEIDVNTIVSDRTGGDGSKLRGMVKEKLKTVMAEYGASYGIIEAYAIKQTESSWEKTSCALKYFLLLQRENPSDAEDYYLGGKSMDYLRDCFKRQKGSEADLYGTQYAKSIIMYKAFTAIALEKVNFEGKDPEKRVCKLTRLVEHQALAKSYENYEDLNEGDIFNGMKQGIADSTSLGVPVEPFYPGFTPTIDTHEMEVPFSKIYMLYFMSSGLNRGGDVHEVVCDMNNIPVKILQSAKTGAPVAV